MNSLQQMEMNNIDTQQTVNDSIGIVFTAINLTKKLQIKDISASNSKIIERLTNLTHQRNLVSEDVKYLVSDDHVYVQLLNKSKQLYLKLIEDYKKQRKCFQDSPLCALLNGVQVNQFNLDFQPLYTKVFQLSQVASKFVIPKTRYEQFSEEFVKSRFYQSRAEYSQAVQQFMTLSKIDNLYKQNYINLTILNVQEVKSDIKQNLDVLCANFGLFNDVSNILMYFKQCYMQQSEIQTFKAIFRHLYQYFGCQYDDDYFMQLYQYSLIKLIVSQILCNLDDHLFGKDVQQKQQVECINDTLKLKLLLIASNNELEQSLDHYQIKNNIKQYMLNADLK